MLRWFKPSLLLVLLTSAAVVPAGSMLANDAIDTAVTGSIDPATDVVPANPRGSAPFRAALDLLVDGDPADAYAAATSLTNAAERRAIQFAAIQFHAGAIDHDAIARFAVDAPNYLSETTLRTRIEQSLVRASAPAADVLEAIDDADAATLDGRIALAQALLASGDTEAAAPIARALWIENFLTTEQEAAVRRTLGSLLRREDHWARVERLMMHDRIQGAERLEQYLTEPQKSLLAARAATAREQSDGKALLDAVDASLHDHPVYIYTRVQRAREAGLFEQAIDWLDRAPAAVPEGTKWAEQRLAITRAMLADGQPRLAYRAVAGFTEGPAGRVVEAQFNAGWIALTFLDDAQAAQRHFTIMTEHATLPDTVTQSHYWLAQAEIALGNFPQADAAYGVAAQYGTVYYGQLARGQLGFDRVSIRPLPDVESAETLFNQHDIARAVRLFAANGQRSYAVPLLRNWAQTMDDGAQLVLAARLAQEIGAHNVAIAIADIGTARGFGLEAYAFPRAGIPDTVRFAAEKAAVYAVARQESLFQLDAVSHAGARGLMQLMPGTARETAERLGLEYSVNRLVTDASYNVLLGSTYLSDQLERYDGSLILAAAAYNAGPGNANKWIRAYGDPRAADVDPVVWVELIPFAETRKYVQRVLGNYLVYRERLGDDPVAIAQALRTIR